MSITSTVNPRKRSFLLLGMLGALIIVIALTWSVATPDTSSTKVRPFKSAQKLSIADIRRTFTVPASLGAVTFTINGPASILLYSSSYERLATRCDGHHIAELQLSDTALDPATDIDLGTDGQYHYAHPILHPMGVCAGNTSQEKALYAAAQTMFQSASK